MYDRASKQIANDKLSHATASSITSPSDTAPLVTETLRKSGVDELLDSQVQRLGDIKITDDATPSNKPAKVEGPASDLASPGVIQNAESTVSKDDANASVRRKKSVAFAKGTKEEDATTSRSRNIAGQAQSKSHSLVENKLIF